MKKSPQYLRRTMRQAKALQARYDALGASRYQAIRNPLPMRSLVVDVLPVLPDPDTIVPVTTTVQCRFRGKDYTKRVKSYDYARNVIPQTEWAKRGMTVQDVMASLEAKGFIVRSEVTVRCMLSQGRSLGLVETVSPARGRKGRPRSFYFATE